jgi:hypothetical protein
MNPTTTIEMFQVENIPQELCEHKQWVVWCKVKRKGKLTKVPLDPKTGGAASSTDSSTWGTFEQAIQTCRNDSKLAGVGFVFTMDDSFCGVDLDDSISSDNGQLKPWAQSIINQLDSYTEISPSGSGVKVFLKARKPGNRCRKVYHDGEVEIYDRDRFFTLTGRRLQEAPTVVEDRREALNALYYEILGTDDDKPAILTLPSPGGNGQVPLEDDEIIRLASRQRRSGEKFAALWAGRWKEHFNSPSEADSSVIFTLAFYSKDAAQLDRLFRQSGLMRPKWDEYHGEQTYGQITIAKALAKVVKQYAPKQKSKKSPRPTAPLPANPGLPAIIIDDMQLSDLTTKAMDALAQANAPPLVFVRAGTVARVVRDENGLPKIEPFDRVRMRCRLTEVANFFKLRRRESGYEPVGINPPLSLAENVLALGHWDFPSLAGIARAPILRDDSTICMKPGYDPVSRLIYCPDPGLTLSPIPENPNINEVHACVDLLLGLISDFPFADEASRANAMAILFSVLMRPVIAGHVPLAIVDAPAQGTGKTLLVTTFGTIAVGSVATESIPSKQNDDEWRKKITSILLAASPFVLLDNIPDNSTIDSSSLAAALTTHEWSDRLLGRNDTIRLPSRAVWVATGNNLRVAGDMPRRSFGIRLDANTERPWERTGFKIAGLEQHVLANRGDLLAAALTIIRAWYTNGRPKSPVSPLGSFEDWAQTIGSVLAFAGIHGFLGNLAKTQLVQDEDTQQWTAFFETWWDTFGSGAVTVSDLCQQIIARDGVDERALPDALLVHRDHGEGALRRSLGRHLLRLMGRIFNGHKLLDAGNDGHRKVRSWKLAGLLTPQETNNPASNPAEKGLW